MTIESSSRSNSMKVCGQAAIKLTTPGSAIRLATDCTTWHSISGVYLGSNRQVCVNSRTFQGLLTHFCAEFKDILDINILLSKC